MSRYVKRDARVYPTSGCLYCGTSWGGYKDGCPETTCLACGTTQCLGNGTRDGTCAVCYVGLLPGWSGTDRKCGYKACPRRAVAQGPRVRHVCGGHAAVCIRRGRSGQIGPQSVAAYISARLRERAVGWVLVEAPAPRPTDWYSEPWKGLPR